MLPSGNGFFSKGVALRAVGGTRTAPGRKNRPRSAFEKSYSSRISSPVGLLRAIIRVRQSAHNRNKSAWRLKLVALKLASERAVLEGGKQCVELREVGAVMGL
jgi:hypothetical protein